MNDGNCSKRFDKFKAEIFCRVCRSNGHDDKHHPNMCRSCFHCGEKHDRKECPMLNPYHIPKIPKIVTDLKPKNPGLAMRRYAIFDNGDKLEPDEPVAIDIEKVRGVSTPTQTNPMLPGWIVVYQFPTKKRKANMEKVVYSAKIRQLKHNVQNYATRWSGLARIDLSEEAIEFEQVKK